MDIARNHTRRAFFRPKHVGLYPMLASWNLARDHADLNSNFKN